MSQSSSEAAGYRGVHQAESLFEDFYSNETVISFKKGKLEFIVNGKTPVSIEVGGAEWNKLINASKFKDMPAFAKITKGHIALQDHGGAVWYRNLMIKTF